MRFQGPFRFFISGLFVLFFFSMTINCSAQSSQPLEAFLFSDTDQAASDEPIFVNYRIENNSDAAVKIPAALFSPAPIGLTGLSFSVIDPGGNILDSICSESGVDSITVITMFPGEFHGRNSIMLNKCYPMNTPGTYRVTAVFTSTITSSGTWNGILSSNQITIDIKQGRVQKIATDATAILNSWKQNYDITTAEAYKQHIAAMGLSAVPAIANMLHTSENYSFTSDLIDLLTLLPSQESGDALLAFAASAHTRKFHSNMPEGFSASNMLVGEALLAMATMTKEDLSLQRRVFPGATTEELWNMWWTDNRSKFPSALSSTNILE